MALAKSIAVMAGVMAALCGFSFASNSFIVGDSAGWTTAADYKNWASDKDFYVGDTLQFNYNPQQHNLMEVSKEDFKSCNPGTPIGNYNSGNDVVPLATAGQHYFICSFHCAGGMKLRVKVKDHGPHQPQPSPPQAAGGLAPPAVNCTPTVGGDTPPVVSGNPYYYPPNRHSGASVTSALVSLSLVMFGVCFIAIA